MRSQAHRTTQVAKWPETKWPAGATGRGGCCRWASARITRCCRGLARFVRFSVGLSLRGYSLISGRWPRRSMSTPMA
ncbi:hypothetical protein C4K38_2749 [Pseudomonas chlororaphis subsp. piscium]|nr:hypothetical protein C4K38_2749 [Pseudomonas chlororaphis subsp. piscium]